MEKTVIQTVYFVSMGLRISFVGLQWIKLVEIKFEFLIHLNLDLSSTEFLSSFQAVNKLAHRVIIEERKVGVWKHLKPSSFDMFNVSTYFIFAPTLLYVYLHDNITSSLLIKYIRVIMVSTSTLICDIHN